MRLLRGRVTVLGCYMVACGAVGLPLFAVTLGATPFSAVHRHYALLLALTVTL